LIFPHSDNLGSAQLDAGDLCQGAANKAIAL
jgi:hypothetical protein